MEKIRCTYIMLVLWFISCTVMAQEHPVRASSQNPFWELQSRQIEIEAANEFSGENPNSVENTEGSPYANENFVFGKIFVNDKMLKKNVLLRYNILAEEIEIGTGISDNENSYDALLKDPSFYAKIGNAIYIFATYKESAAAGGYFALIEPGVNYDLYEKTKVKFVAAKEPRPYRPAQPAKFFRSSALYLVTKDGNFFKLPNSKSKILKVMDDKKDTINQFMKTNSIDLDKRDDFIKLFKYYDSIVAQEN